MRMNGCAAPRAAQYPKGGDRPGRRPQGDSGRGAGAMNSAMADAFAKLKR